MNMEIWNYKGEKSLVVDDNIARQNYPRKSTENLRIKYQMAKQNTTLKSKKGFGHVFSN